MPGTINIHSTQEEVLEAIKSDASALLSANSNFKNNGLFILQAISINPIVFKYADDTLRKDMDFACLAYKRNPSVEKYTDIGIRGDKEYHRKCKFMDLGGDPLGPPSILEEGFRRGIVSEYHYVNAPLGAHEKEIGQENMASRLRISLLLLLIGSLRNNSKSLGLYCSAQIMRFLSWRSKSCFNTPVKPSLSSKSFSPLVMIAIALSPAYFIVLGSRLNASKTTSMSFFNWSLANSSAQGFFLIASSTKPLLLML